MSFLGHEAVRFLCIQLIFLRGILMIPEKESIIVYVHFVDVFKKGQELTLISCHPNAVMVSDLDSPKPSPLHSFTAISLQG